VFYLTPGTSQTGPAMSSTFVGATGSGAIAPFTIPIGGMFLAYKIKIKRKNIKRFHY